MLNQKTIGGCAPSRISFDPKGAQRHILYFNSFLGKALLLYGHYTVFRFVKQRILFYHFIEILFPDPVKCHNRIFNSGFNQWSLMTKPQPAKLSVHSRSHLLCAGATKKEPSGSFTIFIICLLRLDNYFYNVVADPLDHPIGVKGSFFC